MSMNQSTPKTPFEWLSGGLFFGNRGEKPGEINSCKDVMILLRGASESLSQIISAKNEGGEHADASELIEARLRRLRFLLYQERRQSSQADSPRRPTVAGKTMRGLTGTSDPALTTLVPTLLDNLCELPFETRKDVGAIFNYLLLCGLEGSDGALYVPTMKGFLDFVENHFDAILAAIVRGHDCPGTGTTPDIVLHLGSMYRSCLKHLSLYSRVVGSSENVQAYVFPFLDKYVHSPNFDVASDAMESLKIVLTGNVGITDEETKAAISRVAANFLTRDYEAIWDERFNPKLLSVSENQSNYIMRRIALQILSTVLLTRSNYKVMVRYVNSKKNLIMVMLLLRDTSPHITLDAFHVFKIFVANPDKPPGINKILSDNKEKLCKYLETLHKEKETNDKQFRNEKAMIIATIEEL